MKKNDESLGQAEFPRIMIAAPSSGSGKTLVTCGLLKVFANRGLCPVSFKCGPDYIDPMFHRKVLGIPSRNLDLFFTGGETTRALFAKGAAQADISLLEGVMGFYDGAGGVTTVASSYELAKVTDTPVLLVVNARGMSLSLLPLIQGFLEFQKRQRNCGGDFKSDLAVLLWRPEGENRRTAAGKSAGVCA